MSFKNVEQNKNNNRSTKPRLHTSSCFAINFAGYLHCCCKESCPWIFEIQKFFQTFPWFCVTKKSFIHVVQKWSMTFFVFTDSLQSIIPEINWLLKRLQTVIFSYIQPLNIVSYPFDIFLELFNVFRIVFVIFSKPFNISLSSFMNFSKPLNSFGFPFKQK